MAATEPSPIEPVSGVLLFTIRSWEVWLHWLPRRYWHYGYRQFWYDGPIHTVAVGPLEVCWYLP